MAEDLIPILTRFHREIVLPDIQRVVGDLRLEMNERFAGLNAHFDALYQRFDRLETGVCGGEACIADTRTRVNETA